MNKSLFAKITNVVLHFLGFPLMLILAIVDGCHWNTFGLYGANAFAGVFIVLFLWVFTAFVEFFVYKSAKKKGKLYTTGSLIKFMAIPTLSIIILLGFIDIVLPKPLQSASSNTIKYEDVVSDYSEFNDKLIGLVDKFKEKNGLDENVKLLILEFNIFIQAIFLLKCIYKSN